MTMTQNLERTLRRHWLTPITALELCGCLSLSQRCGQFRRAGLKVLDRWVDLPSGKRVKSYRIAKS